MNVQDIPLNAKIVDVANELWIYNEPDDIKEKRIKASLPVLTDLILSENIDNFLVPESHPLFLSMYKNGSFTSFGINSWIYDIGYFKYAPAYDNLREVFLWGNEKYNFEAAKSLAKLGNSEILKDIEKIINLTILTPEKIDDFLDILSFFRNKEVINPCMCLMEELNLFYKAENKFYKIKNGEFMRNVCLEEKIKNSMFHPSFQIRRIIDILYNLEKNSGKTLVIDLLNKFSFDSYIQGECGWMKKKEIYIFSNPIEDIKGSEVENVLYGKDCFDIPF